MRYSYTNTNVDVTPMTSKEYKKALHCEAYIENDAEDIPGYRIQHLDRHCGPTIVDYWEEKNWCEKHSLFYFFQKMECHEESECFEMLNLEAEKNITSKYVGCKLVEATQSIRLVSGEIIESLDELKAERRGSSYEEGYSVTYADGYTSWSPKDVFEKAYIKVDDNKNLPSGVSIGKDMVKKFIKSYEVIEPDEKTTIVHATLINGFTLTESSSCVDPKNYSKDIGTKNCLKKIEDKIFELLGFLLQTAFEGVKYNG